MEQNRNISQPSDSKPAKTEIDNLLHELIQKDTGLLSKENTSQPKSTSDQTPLANLKTLLSAADAVAKGDKNITNIQTKPIVPKEKSFISAKPQELTAVQRLDELIKAHRSRKNP